jgi:hypothetical protein
VTVITYDDVVAELPAIIATRGEDFVYALHSDSELPHTCTYIYNGEPDCLIGCYLVSKGVPIEAFAPYEGNDVGQVLAQPEFNDLVTVTPEATKLLFDIQSNQDEFIPWGEAYTKAVENLKEDEF